MSQLNANLLSFLHIHEIKYVKALSIKPCFIMQYYSMFVHEQLYTKS